MDTHFVVIPLYTIVSSYIQIQWTKKHFIFSIQIVKDLNESSGVTSTHIPSPLGGFGSFVIFVSLDFSNSTKSHPHFLGAGCIFSFIFCSLIHFHYCKNSLEIKPLFITMKYALTSTQRLCRLVEIDQKSDSQVWSSYLFH